MHKTKKLFSAALMICMGLTVPAYAIFGVGIHYILDNSVKMDGTNEKLIFDKLQLNTKGFVDLPSADEWVNQKFGSKDIPIYFDRGDMGRTPFGLGIKIYVDVIPFIDCIEIGSNFTAFQYDGKIKYPTSVTVKGTAPSTPAELLSMMDDEMVSVQYDSISTNVEDLADGVSIPGIKKTPYVKLDMDLTIRKYIPIPVITKVLRPYGGLGFDCIFATPVPSAGLVNDAIGDKLSGSKSVEEVMSVMQDSKTPQKIVDELISRLMTPHFGMNVMLGFMLKPPVFPVGIYVDGKYMIPFGKLDDDANVTGYGFKLDAGLCLHFGSAK